MICTSMFGKLSVDHTNTYTITAPGNTHGNYTLLPSLQFYANIFFCERIKYHNRDCPSYV